MSSHLASIAYRIPIIGWMLKSAVQGDDSELVYFLLCLLLGWGLCLMIFGYPALIIGALSAAAIALATILVLTRG